jgi:hypothetical protein
LRFGFPERGRALMPKGEYWDCSLVEWELGIGLSWGPFGRLEMDGWVDHYSFEGEYKCECIGCVVDKWMQNWALWQYSVIWMDGSLL